MSHLCVPPPDFDPTNLARSDSLPPVVVTHHQGLQVSGFNREMLGRKALAFGSPSSYPGLGFPMSRVGMRGLGQTVCLAAFIPYSSEAKGVKLYGGISGRHMCYQ